MTLAESGNLLIMRNRTAAWVNDAKKLIDVGSAAYQAAQTKNAKALASLADPLDASCTSCHKQFRPSVFPAKPRP
jgi:cytochrome c556